MVKIITLSLLLNLLQAQAAGEFIEVSTVNDHLYGIKSADIEHMFEHSGSIYLILNRFGAETLKKIYGDHVVLIFIHAQTG